MVIGSALNNGEVHDAAGRKIGRVDAEEHVYERTSRVGVARNDGRVYDYNGRHIGKIVGNHIDSGGAVLLLLVG